MANSPNSEGPLMEVATDLVILDNIHAPRDRKAIDLARKPSRLYWLHDEAAFRSCGAVLGVRRLMHQFDQGHDWSWSNGTLRFFGTDVDEGFKLLAVFAIEERPESREIRFCPECGSPVKGGECPQGHPLPTQGG